MRILNVVGARPQFIKAAAVCAAFREEGSITDVLVHTGQHYDPGMSDVFFDELDLPKPDRFLGIKATSHAEQTAAMLVALETVTNEETPDLVLVYGDTNTTLAAALAAAKLHVPVGHVEAGLRSFDRRMPEEVNRVVTDHLAALHFCPTQTAVSNLAAEGITQGVHMVGDVMADILMMMKTRARGDVLDEMGLEPGGYYLLTIHRASNTDDPGTLRALVDAVAGLDRDVVFLVHPRTAGALERHGITLGGAIRAHEPVGYLDSLALQAAARAILTDSGGMQKEAYMLGVPCVTLRSETEWPETVHAGWNTLAGTDAGAIRRAAMAEPPIDRPLLYGEGRAAHDISAICTSWHARAEADRNDRERTQA